MEVNYKGETVVLQLNSLNFILRKYKLKIRYVNKNTLLKLYMKHNPLI